MAAAHVRPHVAGIHAGLVEHFDVVVLVDKLTRAEIDEFFTFVDAATAFAEQIRAALTTPTLTGPEQRPHLTAI